MYEYLTFISAVSALIVMFIITMLQIKTEPTFGLPYNYYYKRKSFFVTELILLAVSFFSFLAFSPDYHTIPIKGMFINFENEILLYLARHSHFIFVFLGLLYFIVYAIVYHAYPKWVWRECVRHMVKCFGKKAPSKYESSISNALYYSKKLAQNGNYKALYNNLSELIKYARSKEPDNETSNDSLNLFKMFFTALISDTSDTDILKISKGIHRENSVILNTEKFKHKDPFLLDLINIALFVYFISNNIKRDGVDRAAGTILNQLYNLKFFSDTLIKDIALLVYMNCIYQLYINVNKSAVLISSELKSLISPDIKNKQEAMLRWLAQISMIYEHYDLWSIADIIVDIDSSYDYFQIYEYDYQENLYRGDFT